ncbi:Demethylmenaquinone methyltransferase [bioreactor metagenome]|jgi:demethylmenaquinone methyltransferase/2-methoxy-6-polyprenyl-1,4-benzoquinol methylase|uniref:Demethylmenaquinone methyltransferase n=1 Tax=bioreactor metagenome TaxID=1076179 RepID=A0A644UXN7_9ZZZZ|nr:ubiquinone/menaquinone biosynthesis methyltransferase [Lentimicrobium sp.]MEA5110670.1 ubiquinone/menaquinone biosynthesis methyltransferase [Lentimicrobium sp.]HCT70091.1 bifunctional demethylmenaquinone methyltransferase/2-methoxy-6-polyprenyl-1,4-benzoquinol methylase [Bacteroidales bacterium]
MFRDEKGYRPTQQIFTEVPPKYDILNRILTLNLDEGWRRKASATILEENPSRVLDLCCGTADLTMHLARSAKQSTELYGLDFSHTMLARAKEKVVVFGDDRVKLIQGDAGNMPFENEFFDAVGISFGFRNLTFENPDAQLHISEVFRVLKPGGRFVVLETSQPKNRLIRAGYHVYQKYITAPIGGLLSGNRPAYDYLAHSAVNYYSIPEISEVLLEAGFSKVSGQPYLLGATAIVTAIK